MKKNFIHRKNCRICQNSDFLKIIDLGEFPLANAFLKKEDLNKSELKFPLILYLCRNCHLLQLLDVVNPSLLFDYYHYLTSTNPPLVNHFLRLGKSLIKRFITSKEDLVAEIGGNDAVLLASIKDKCRVLNIEPAKNIAKISRKKGVETIAGFFDKKSAEKVLEKFGPAKIIIANNVIAHIDNLDEVLAGIKILLDKKGVFVFEVHWVANLLGLVDIGGFDQIYHEHLSYFSLLALKKIINRYGLEIFDVKIIPIHGRSLQIYISQDHKISKSVYKLLELEKRLGLAKKETYLDFAKKVKENKKEFKNEILKLKKENKKIVGYGAPAKGNTLLNYFQTDNKILDFIVDSSPLKQGLYTPGTHIPIFPPSELKKERPDYILLLAWNYADSIFKKEQELRKKGIKFIIPVPKIKIK